MSILSQALSAADDEELAAMVRGLADEEVATIFRSLPLDRQFAIAHAAALFAMARAEEKPAERAEDEDATEDEVQRALEFGHGTDFSTGWTKEQLRAFLRGKNPSRALGKLRRAGRVTCTGRGPGARWSLVAERPEPTVEPAPDADT